jgi:hypothetical protein
MGLMIVGGCSRLMGEGWILLSFMVVDTGEVTEPRESSKDFNAVVG